MTPLTGETRCGAMQGQRRVAHGGRGGQHLRVVRDGGAVDLRHGLAQLLARGGDLGARRGDGVARVREFLGGDGAVIEQSLRRFRSDSAVRQRRFALLDLRAQLPCLREQPAHLAHRARQVRLGIAHGDLRIGRIELQQRLRRPSPAGCHRRSAPAPCPATSLVTCTTSPLT